MIYTLYICMSICVYVYMYVYIHTYIALCLYLELACKQALLLIFGVLCNRKALDEPADKAILNIEMFIRLV